MQKGVIIFVISSLLAYIFTRYSARNTLICYMKLLQTLFYMDLLLGR